MLGIRTRMFQWRLPHKILAVSDHTRQQCTTTTARPSPLFSTEKPARNTQGCFYHAPFDHCYAITLINYFSKCKSSIYFASHFPIVIMFLPTIFSRERNKKTCTADVINLFKTWRSVRERNIIHKGSSKYCPQDNGDTQSFKRKLKQSSHISKAKNDCCS